MLINCDLKQIEVVVLAQLSGDKAFIKLLNDGVDIYKYFACFMYDKEYDFIIKQERDDLKEPVLGMSYGKGAKAMAKKAGKPEEWCKQFIETYYSTFPKVKETHNKWLQIVKDTGELQMFDGIRLQFKYWEKTWSEEYNCWFKAGYKPTEIKNYPVQHTAFVIFSLFLGEFWRRKALHNRHKYLLINTVHDSMMLDCRNKYIEDAKKDIQEVLDTIPDLLYNMYGLKLQVPLRVDITTGHSWYELG